MLTSVTVSCLAVAFLAAEPEVPEPAPQPEGETIEATAPEPEPPIEEPPAEEKAPSIEELGEEHGWEELPEQPETTGPSVAEKHAAELSETPRGWIFGARLERDVLVWDQGVDLIPALYAIWADRTFGAAVHAVFSWPLGVRAEGRWYPLSRGMVRPWLAAGPVLYGLDIGVHLSGGATVKVWGPWVVGADVAYEYFLKKEPEFTDTIVAVSLFAGYNL